MSGPDWTFGPLVRALALGLHAQNPSFLRSVRRPGDGPLELPGLLTRALTHGGAPAVLRAMELGLDRVGPAAIHAVALRSGDVRELLFKWQRLERYAFSELHTRFDPESGPKELAWSRQESTGWGHDLFVAGTLMALAARLGAQVMTLSVGKQVLFDPRGYRDMAAPPEPRRFTLSWGKQRSRQVEPIEMPRLGGTDPTGAVRRATRLVATDPARSWALDDVGRTMSLSRRTLQRRLATADLDFPGLVRGVRVHYATRLIRGGRSLNEVAFICGFADAAHFSRTFRRVVGMPPSRYRDLNDRDSGVMRQVRAALRP